MPSTSADRIQGINTSVAVKAPVKVASTANLTLSGEQTIVGVACADGDRVLVKAQTTPSENGIYVVSTGAWTRAKDFDGNRDVVKGTLIPVANDTTYLFYRVTADNPIRIGSTSITIEAATQLADPYPISDAEIDVDVTVVDTSVPYGHVTRYGENTVPGTTDMTAAFNSATLVGQKVIVPRGTYLVSNIAVRNNMWIEGEGDHVSLLVGTNNAGAFRHANDEFLSFINIRNMFIGAAPGVTGARAYLQDYKSNYTAYAEFHSITTSKNLAISYDGFFITSRWSLCTDGYFGSPPGGQDHYFISSVAAGFAQFNQTNLCVVDGCRIFGATAGAPAAIDIAYGGRWTFCGGTDFETLETRAIRARGILGGAIHDCWFENIDTPDYVITIATDTTGQSCGSWDISNNNIVLINLGGNGGSGFVSPSDVFLTLRSNTCFNIPSGKVLVADAFAFNAKLEHNRALSGAGAADFINKLQEGETGDVTLDMDGIGGTSSHNVTYVYSDGIVTLKNNTGFTGTSDSTSCSLGTLPEKMRPSENQLGYLAPVTDNGSDAVGLLRVQTTGVISAAKSISATGTDWTSSGTKAIGAFTISYPL